MILWLLRHANAIVLIWRQMTSIVGRSSPFHVVTRFLHRCGSWTSWSAGSWRVSHLHLLLPCKHAGFPDACALSWVPVVLVQIVRLVWPVLLATEPALQLPLREFRGPVVLFSRRLEILYCHQQCTRAPSCPHPLRHSCSAIVCMCVPWCLPTGGWAMLPHKSAQWVFVEWWL